MPEAESGPRVDAKSVDAAIAKVLQAERDAREDVQRCAREAETIVERAHEGTREIARRAADRGVRVQRWTAATLQRQLDHLAQQHAQLAGNAVPSDTLGRLQQIVETLAAQLTGAEQ